MLRTQTIPHALKALCAALTVCVVAGFAPSKAHAGEYVVPFCGKSVTGSTRSWTHSATGGASPYFFVANNCGPNGGYHYRRFEVWSVPAGASDDWTFDAPAGTYISKLAMYQDTAPRSAGALNGIYAWQQDGSKTTVAASRPGTVLKDATYAFPLSGSKVIKLRNSLLCQDGANCGGTAPDGSYGNEEYWKGAVVHLIDPTSPAFDSVGGAGWTAAPVDGVDTINYVASDVGAGVREVRFLVDGVLQATKTAGCTAEAIKPCPAQATGSFNVDTTKLSEGDHSISLVAVDGASNQTPKPLTITVRRAPQPSGETAGDPVSTTNPGHSAGTAPAVGDHLQGDQGSWSGTDLAYAYQWNRCDLDGQNCLPIPGATGLTYTPTTSDVGHALEFCVTASNSGGSATSCSAPTLPVIASHPVTTTTPPPTSGEAETADLPGEPTPARTTAPSSGASAGTSAGRGSANGSPAADRVVLTALTNSRSTTKKVKFGKRAPIGGRLLGPNGAPIVGAIISVQARTAMPSAKMTDAAQVVTGDDGRFTYMAPAGPSRTIRFGYRAYSADTSFADTTDVQLLVSAGVTMKATPRKVRNRHATMFRGRLRGKPIPRRGVVVDLQVFFRKQWRTFATPRTSRAGRYKFKYRFMAGSATWKFRARVRRETSYPYTLGYSRKPVKVKVA